MKTKRKNIELSLLFALIFSVLLSCSHFDAACSDIRQSVVRLHIKANSDSVSDQELKLCVRDAVLAECGDLFECGENYNEALKICQNNTDLFEDIANSVIKEKGFDYKARAEVCDTYFETRVYDTFTLPAGTYKSLNITLGKAEGKNWWCVVFPTVCIPSAAKTDLSESVDKYGTEITSNAPKYIAKFKLVEIYEDLKQKLS